MVTKRLGKGLEALIRPYEETQAAATPVGVTDILLSKIKANPNQPRKDGLDKSSLEDLVASIKEKVSLHPLPFRKWIKDLCWWPEKDAGGQPSLLG